MKECNNECNHSEDLEGLIGSFMMSKEITRINALGKRPIIPHYKDVKTMLENFYEYKKTMLNEWMNIHDEKDVTAEIIIPLKFYIHTSPAPVLYYTNALVPYQCRISME